MKSLMVLTLVIFVSMVPESREASACNVCHSKNPKMVKMHEEQGFKDCFKCHGRGMEKMPERQKAQMVSDERCIHCHKN